MKKLFIIAISSVLLAACGPSTKHNESTGDAPAMIEKDPSTYDPKRGEGKFDHVELGAQLDVAMARKGKAIYDLKCSSCHKLTDERLVGPGWKGVSQKHEAAWIMNFITNPDPMIDKDPELQAQLEICLVRMPNQSLSDEDARHIVEFMRENDGVK